MVKFLDSREICLLIEAGLPRFSGKIICHHRQAKTQGEAWRDLELLVGTVKKGGYQFKVLTKKSDNVYLFEVEKTAPKRPPSQEEVVVDLDDLWSPQTTTKKGE